MISSICGKSFHLTFPYFVLLKHKIREREKLLPKIKEIAIGKAQRNNQNILMVTAVFLNQKRVCEHTTNMTSLESF
jgi:hypothetical protein